MCYKNEEQKKAATKLVDKLENIPEFIQNYFVFLTSNKTKLTNWSYIRQLLEWLIKQNIIKSTLYNITPADLNSVTDIHIINYLDGLKTGLYGTKNTHTTIETKKNVFSGFWSYLQDKDYVRKNIITKQVSGKYKVKVEKEVTVPTDEEIESFISNIQNIKSEIIAIRNIAIVKLFLGSGIRIEELVGIDLEDFIIDENGRAFVTVMEKGEQDEKIKVPISKAARMAVEDYLKIRNLNVEIKDLVPLFISERNERLALNSIQQFFKTYSNDTIHPHMLRHYVGTQIYRNGTIEMARDQLRHKDINTTIKHYVAKDKQATYSVLDSI